ncbi:unnamed protein product [Onchocerca flexuosa]|uniref:RT_RNaseH_2 domain-containing protein n=1 Tax=Onchocerca flexuosa TaxID=387005 RepID=A0A183HLT6_9BILA|nr:unnamed protein product [Onchocerca flexuosa]
MELEDTTRRPSDQTPNITDLWKKDISWGEKLEPEEMRRCFELEKAFNQLDVMEISQWTPQEYTEIHVFVDASERAVGLALLAVTLGVRALEFIGREIEVGKTYLWTDSVCVLHWLRKPPVGSRYISNRIDEIRRCKEIEYRHVRSTNNPADKT